ncbi:phosphatase PAP2 family protein [Paracoccus sp. 22332]|uniref:phosphatase PAP2 family protein n=1 Tax=Paracoccus sp. 22332 TaxID=3453913 RepID=UPI003F84F248
MLNSPQDHHAAAGESLKTDASRCHALLSLRAALICATLCWVVFAVLAGLMLSGRYADLDNLGLLLFRSSAGLELRGPSWAANMTRGITELGGVTLRHLLAASAVAMLLLFGMRRQAAILSVTIFSGWMISALLKLGFARPRPTNVSHLMGVEGYSFPSGHSFNAAVVYISLGIVLGTISRHCEIRRTLVLTGVAISALVALSRVMLGVHYPSDALAGWIAGAGWALLASAWLSMVSTQSS